MGLPGTTPRSSTTTREELVEIRDSEGEPDGLTAPLHEAHKVEVEEGAELPEHVVEDVVGVRQHLGARREGRGEHVPDQTRIAVDAPPVHGSRDEAKGAGDPVGAIEHLCAGGSALGNGDLIAA
jgi:hypothetical protein